MSRNGQPAYYTVEAGMNTWPQRTWKMFMIYCWMISKQYEHCHFVFVKKMHRGKNGKIGIKMLRDYFWV